MADRKRSSERPLSSRFLLYYALTYLLLIGMTGVFVDRSTRDALIDETIRDLEVVAELAQATIPDSQGEYRDWADVVFEASGFRLTLIAVDGVVQADSHLAPEGMENHAGRPEVVAAVSGEIGTARRTSASTGAEQLYLALPAEDGLVVRTSVASRVIDSELNAVRSSIVLISVLAGLVGVLIVAYLARRMAKPITELTEQSLEVAAGNLDVEPRRSAVRELDQLGSAISTIAEELGSRVTEAERATEYLQVVLGALAQGTILVEREDRIVYANPAARSLLGDIPDALDQLTPYQCQTLTREARESQEPQERLVEHGKPLRRLRVVATPFRDDDRTLLVIIDVTAQERAEAIRRDFVANASHELKTPVTTIIASADALEIAVERGDASAVTFARQIRTSTRQLDDLVSDLLDLSRLERETPDLAPLRLDLVALEELERVREVAESGTVHLEATVDPVTVQGNHRDIAIAVRNLLDNAIRYTPAGGSVVVAVRAGGGEGELSVSDTGEGIPSRDLDRVFERFYRVDAGRARATGGTGLGLSIVRHVVDGHGGTVEVESELGSGSTFTVRLPLATSG